MARKRMFSLDIIDTDTFIEMPQSSRLLYYELCMRADDDGFVSSPKKIIKMVGCSDDDFKVLIAKQFVIPFDTGVVVIRHWKLHNYIQKDRYKETIYTEEKEQLQQEDNGMYTKCIQDVYTDKIRLDKISIDKNKEENKKEEKIYFDNEDVNSIFNEFLILRKKLKAVNSDRAITLLLNKLNNYDDEIKIKMIEQSILNSWKGIFELKKDKKKDSFMEMLDEWAKEE